MSTIANACRNLFVNFSSIQVKLKLIGLYSVKVTNFYVEIVTKFVFFK